MTDKHHSQWQGRHDEEDGALGLRVHHIVEQGEQSDANSNSVSLIGFATDEGVRRNKGRVGAAGAPDLIRNALANMAWHNQGKLLDHGNISCDGNNLEASQQACADRIAKALNDSKTIVLGGGHEIAWASFQGLAQHLQQSQSTFPKVGILNFDAHFDLRSYQDDAVTLAPSSGTPFHQIHDLCESNGWAFQYGVLGISRASNTQALFQRADDMGVWYLEDHQLTLVNQQQNLEALQRFIDDSDVLYLTIDLDVFQAATAPGVSAPAARGVSLDNVSPYFELILQQPKLMLADIAEYNPRFDIDNQTARLAARLCWDIANAMLQE